MAPCIRLYSWPTMDGLADAICRGTNFERGKLRCATFLDGTPDLEILDISSNDNAHVVFLANFDGAAHIFEQYGLIRKLIRNLASKFTLILPYSPMGTMERADRDGRVATARTLAVLLSSLPSPRHDKSIIVCYDFHTTVERSYFEGDTVLPHPQSALPLLKAKIGEVYLAPPTIAFPDEGSYKRFKHHFEDFSQIVLYKERNGDDRKVKLVEGNPEGQHIVIVDDLVQTGGTLEETAKLLLAKGAETVSAFVTHAVFPNNSWQRFCTDDPTKQLTHFWVTDSYPTTVDQLRGHSPFEVLSLADPIRAYILGRKE